MARPNQPPHHVCMEGSPFLYFGERFDQSQGDVDDENRVLENCEVHAMSPFAGSHLRNIAIKYWILLQADYDVDTPGLTTSLSFLSPV